MPVKELTEPREDGSAIQVVTTLPMRPRRHESGKGGQPDSVSEPESRSRIPRITRLMALAIKFQDMVARGEVRDFADLARLGYVTRARLTQIMNLLLLAPDIQEVLLLSAAIIQERRLRIITKRIEWKDQRKLFSVALGKPIERTADDSGE